MLKKNLLGKSPGLALLVVAILIFLPAIIKKVIEIIDVELIGRQVTIGRISINYFRGRIIIRDFKLYEADGKTVFTGFEKLGVQLGTMDMFRSEYTFKNLDLLKPYANIAVVDGKFNFDDLIHLEPDSTGNQSKDTKKTEPLKWSLSNIAIQGGKLKYSDQMFSTALEFADLNMTSAGMAWNSDTLPAELSFIMTSGGSCNYNCLT